MKKILLLSIFLLGSFAMAQVGIGTTNPNPDSILDVLSTDKGVLLPRIALSSTNLPNPLTAFVAGMLIYNTATVGSGSTTVFPGVYYSDGSSWTSLKVNSVGNIKNSFMATDHEGWYILDGRLLSTLSATAQANALALGFIGNLPNASDRFLKTSNGAETLGATGGSSTITINQTNLPNINFTGTTNVAGAHTHDYTDQGDTTINSISLLGLGSGADNTSGPYTTSSSGDHSHTVTVASGGSGTAITNKPAYIVINLLVYLGG